MILAVAVVNILLQTELAMHGRAMIGGAPTLAVFWLVMTVATLGARDALRRAMARPGVVNIADPLKLNAREVARLQGLTRSAMVLAAVGCAVLMAVYFCLEQAFGSVENWIHQVLASEILDAYLVDPLVILICMGAAALWILLEIVNTYLRAVEDGKFALRLEIAVSAALLGSVVTPNIGVVLLAVTAVIGVCLLIALVRMRRVRPWMPRAEGRNLMRELPAAFMGVVLYPLLVGFMTVVWNGRPWMGYTGGPAFHQLIVVPMCLGLAVLEFGRSPLRRDRERTATLVAGVTVILLLVGLLSIAMRYGVVDADDPMGALFRMQFFFMAGFVLMVMYARQNWRLVIAEFLSLIGSGIGTWYSGGLDMFHACVIVSCLIVLLCLPEWISAGRRVKRWMVGI